MSIMSFDIRVSWVCMVYTLGMCIRWFERDLHWKLCVERDLHWNWCIYIVLRWFMFYLYMLRTWFMLKNRNCARFFFKVAWLKRVGCWRLSRLAKWSMLKVFDVGGWVCWKVNLGWSWGLAKFDVWTMLRFQFSILVKIEHEFGNWSAWWKNTINMFGKILLVI